MNKVYLCEQIHDDALAYLSKNFEIVHGAGIENVTDEEREAEAMIVRVAKVTAEVIDSFPKLRVIAKHGVGVDTIDVKTATERGILVINAPMANIHAVAEHTTALILALSKKLVMLDGMTRRGGFKKRNEYVLTELRRKTLGFVGYGRIARLVHKKLSGFEMNFAAYDPFIKGDGDGSVRMMPLEELLAESDIISLHVPLTAETRHIINADALKRMKPSAFLVNASRGANVDQEALYKALLSHEMAGAALDVFEEEPPANDLPLWKLDNIIVSPHNAALSDSALRAMGMDCAVGITDYLIRGVRPEYPVNVSVLN